jgi:cytochrome c553
MNSGRVLAGIFAIGPFGLLLASSPDGPKVDFNHDVQPILSAHCSRCHGGDQKQGGFSFQTSKLMLVGGDSGKLVVPGKSGNSLLISRIEGKGGMPRMPMGFGPLSEKDIATIRTWIDQGCTISSPGNHAHWAYVKPICPKIPKTSNPTWIRNPIDAFVLSRLDNEGLKPSPQADKITLIRRLTLDLTGLPPTPQEVDAFMGDRSPNAYEKVVDRLFASPHYGERMALPWLDAARYADSNGFQQDGDTYQYVWRDWVIKAMNANMPFDQFTTFQLAGDLLPTAGKSDQAIRDQLIATAFNRNHMLNGEGGAIPEEQRNVALFDRVDTTSTTWLGLTMTCARCHDHKYDPLTQKDYYSLLAFFNNVPETGTPTDTIGQYYIAKPWVFAGSDADMAKMKTLEAAVAAETDKKKKDATQKTLDQFKNSIPKVMVMSDAQPRKSHIYSRGNYEAPLDAVSCATPAVFPPMPKAAPNNRLGLAEWMMSPENPLTARVQVNRYWQTFFGKGLVKTPENFGVQSEPPTNPELLDWLAVEFRESGWDVKHIQRLIVTSSTYRQSSKVSPQMEKLDPANRFLARGGRFRLPSMLLRDEALAASGLINLQMYGKPVYPYQPKAIWSGLNITDERDFTYPQSKGFDLYRRSVYTFWRRTIAPGDMFDAASRQVCTVRQSQTSTPLHALTTLNDVTWVEAGRALASLMLRSANTGPDARLSEAFRRVCARRPSAKELQILNRMLTRSLSAFRADPASADAFLNQGEFKRGPKQDPIELAAYSNVCLAIFNLDEALTRE